MSLLILCILGVGPGPGQLAIAHPVVAHVAHGQQPLPSHGISSTRAKQIQKALVRVGYLRRVSGVWDSASDAAMKRFQADRHWQTKYVPDARALIALGLGPAAVAVASK